MIGVLTHHWAKSDCFLKADTLLKGNGKAQSEAPGFVHRRTLYSLSDPNQITSLVIWKMKRFMINGKKVQNDLWL